jgi:glycosyltransferase involved in cell wall biosynthesis
LKLTVLLPVAKLDFFREALSSVITAGKNLEYEILIIDVTRDGLARELALAKNNIRLISLPGGSYEKAIHAGLQNSKGRYIALMNDDDLSALNRFETQLNLLEGSSADIAVGNLQKIGKYSITFNLYPDLKGFSPEMLLLGAYGANAAAMFKKEWLIKHFEISEYPVWDWQFALEKYKYGKIIGTNETLYYYRQHSGQITNSAGHLRDILESIPTNWLNFTKSKANLELATPLIQALILPRQKRLRLAVVRYSNVEASRIELIRWLASYYTNFVAKKYSITNKIWFLYHAFARLMLK